MTTPALPPGTRPGTGGYTAQLPASAGTTGQARRVASVSGKHHVEEWYTPVSASDIATAVSGLASENYVDSAIGAIALPTRDSLGLDTDDSVEFAEFQSITGSSDFYIDAKPGKDLNLRSKTGALKLSDGNQSMILTGAEVELGSGSGRRITGCTGLDCNGPISATSSDILQQRNGSNPQELQVHEQYTSDTNRSYLSIRAQTGGDYVVASGIGSLGGSTRGIKIGTTSGAGALTSWMEFDTNGIVNFSVDHADVPANDDPTTDAPTDWLTIKMNGTEYQIPLYQ